MTTQNLIYLLDVVISGYIPFGLEIISIMSIILAISVILIKNPISSLLCLIGLFFNIACYLCMLGLTFLGLSYLLVYVGAISILFLFILMLINIRVSELTVNTSNSIPLVLIVSIYFLYVSSEILPNDSMFDVKYRYLNLIPLSNYFINFFTSFDIIYDEIYYTSSKSWDGNIAEAAHITSIGNIMYTTYFIWLILISIVLLLAMVGCIVITIK